MMLSVGLHSQALIAVLLSSCSFGWKGSLYLQKRANRNEIWLSEKTHKPNFAVSNIKHQEAVWLDASHHMDGWMQLKCCEFM